MRSDPCRIKFSGHPEWWIFKSRAGYVPTKEAPDDAAEAMRIFNSTMYPNWDKIDYKNRCMK